MSRLMLTMNGGGTWIPPNVEASHKAACARWGCDYQQIINVPHDQHFVLKHDKCLGVCINYERVLWIDGDAGIREDTPDPFELTDPSKFAGVRNAQFLPKGQSEIQQLYWDSVLDFVQVGEYHEPTYINGGFFLFTPSLHSAVFSLVMSWFPRAEFPEAMVEQTLFNMALRQVADLEVLPREWNWVGPEVWTSDEMPGYVSHLAQIGKDYRTGELRTARLNNMEWRCSEAAVRS